ncbi:hypothetical protein J5N97_017089 [Dioscorea zingiberensis]|uniref:Uncharacterized protein n=1 Tax=Dioscorea zingiberensis TaxID=325984 RepID=A0A9D5HG12_9LILI|nr:hypothetical protein J5N97_017089 [Dioscorea zingiberensis]
MMASLLKKLCRSKIFYSCSQNHIFGCSFCFSTSITQNETTPKPQSIVVEYLLSTFGFSPEKAVWASKNLNHLKSFEKPESVLNFLKGYGFDDTQIKKLVSLYPQSLCCDVERTLKPKFEGLEGLGFTGPELAHLILSNHMVLRSSFERNVRPKIEFWRGILGSVELMSKFFRAKQWLLNFSLELRLIPNLALLRKFGIPDDRITMIVQRHPRLILQKPEDLKALAKRVEGMGIPHDSAMFVWALSILQRISKARFHAKLEFMKSLGWSEADFLSAFRKNPIFLTVSELMMKKKIDFLVNEAGCKQPELVHNPQFLMFSLDKRLVPRHHVMQVLKSKGLHSGNYSLGREMSFEVRVFQFAISILSCISTLSKTTLKPQSIVEEYLLSTLGFSPEKATWASEQLNHLKSLENPESVLNCLKSYGFEDTQIKKLVSWYPRWLCFDVETTLKPKFEGLQGLGFSGPELIQLILTNPVILRSSFDRSVRPKIEFWREILGSFELMSKSLRTKQCLLDFSLNQRMLPNLAFLREFGIPDERISLIVQRHPRFISQKPEGMKELAERVEGMGIPRGSKMFVWALNTLRMVTKDKLDGKLGVMKSLGWSEADFLSAFQKSPIFLTVSETMLKKKVDFLVNEAGCKPSELAQKPILLMFSLDKRLIPRYHVMQVLKSKSLNNVKYSLVSIMSYSEKMFVKNFLLCHKKEAPELLDWYIASSKGGAHSNTGLKPAEKQTRK